jgi:hypothetical protein
MDVNKCFMDYLQTNTRKSSQNADEQFLFELVTGHGRDGFTSKKNVIKKVLDLSLFSTTRNYNLQVAIQVFRRHHLHLMTI